MYLLWKKTKWTFWPTQYNPGVSPVRNDPVLQEKEVACIWPIRTLSATPHPNNPRQRTWILALQAQLRRGRVRELAFHLKYTTELVR